MGTGLFKLHGLAKRGYTTEAGPLKCLAAPTFAEQIKTQHAQVRVLRRGDIGHHQVILAHACGEHPRHSLRARQVAAPAQRQNAWITGLQLQLGDGPLPLLGRNLLAAGEHSRHAAQGHLVGAHAVIDTLGDVIHRQLKALLLHLPVTCFQCIPLPADQPAQARQQRQHHQQRQACRRSRHFIHGTSGAATPHSTAT